MQTGCTYRSENRAVFVLLAAALWQTSFLLDYNKNKDSIRAASPSLPSFHRRVTLIQKRPPLTWEKGTITIQAAEKTVAFDGGNSLSPFVYPGSKLSRVSAKSPHSKETAFK